MRNGVLNSVSFRDLWHYTLNRSFVAYPLKEELVLDGIVFRIGDETIGDMIPQYLKKRSQLFAEK